MARRVVIGQLRVQQLTRGNGRRSWTIVWPEGTEHPEADRFLRRHEGSGTQRTYAYLLVDHLRWLERECLEFGAVTLRDLERYMGIVGAEVAMPLGEPWRVGKRPYGRPALSTGVRCVEVAGVSAAAAGRSSGPGRQVTSTCGRRDQSRRPARAPGPRRQDPPPPPARSPSLPAPSPSLSRPAASGRDRSEDRPNAIRCSAPSAAFTCSSSASRCAASSRSRAFSARSSSASRASCRFASSACSSASSGGASAPVSASTPAATATEHSEHPRKPGITHPGRRVAPQSPRRAAQRRTAGHRRCQTPING